MGSQCRSHAAQANNGVPKAVKPWLAAMSCQTGWQTVTQRDTD